MESKTSEEGDYQAFRLRTRFDNLDGLRCICIAMVIWHHSLPPSAQQITLLTRGFLGVDFFFVLSGFLITTLLLRESDRFGSFSLRDFYLRRIIRIIPIYYFVVTCVGVYYIVMKGQGEYLDLWPYYYLFLSNFLIEHIPLLAVTWSLSVEEQYYMLWPLVMLLLPVRYLWPVCVLMIAVNVLGSMGGFGTSSATSGPLHFKLPNATYAPIIMGSLAAILLHNPRGFGILLLLTGHRAAAFVGLICLFGMIQVAPEDIRGMPNLTIHLLMSLILIALVVREDTILTPFLTNPLVARVGVVSYGMYLYHLIALDIVIRTGRVLFGGLDPWAVLAAYFILSYVIAELSFQTLETWFLRFRPARRK